ncbi:MAG TPA: hypothetical protein VFP84_11745 [Kofleriaceae bacterium]|nr:hypothetical protein [Kofleriaceae bacterium]
MSKLVRLKRIDSKKGHVIRRYTAFSTTFEEARGWYRVDDETAAYLQTVHQVPNDEDTPLAFDVCTSDEAEALEAAEKKKAEERARATEPNVAMPRDVVAAISTPEVEARDAPRRGRTAAAGRRA